MLSGSCYLETCSFHTGAAEEVYLGLYHSPLEQLSWHESSSPGSQTRLDWSDAGRGRQKGTASVEEPVSSVETVVAAAVHQPSTAHLLLLLQCSKKDLEEA